MNLMKIRHTWSAALSALMTLTLVELGGCAGSADLAVIMLKEAVEDWLVPVTLSQMGVKANERVIAAGYGADEVNSGLVAFTSKRPVRCFGSNTVAKVEGEIFTLPELLQWLDGSRKTGTLQLSVPGGRAGPEGTLA
jgi:hypothetical protein